jgi:hypothetical protein
MYQMILIHGLIHYISRRKTFDGEVSVGFRDRLLGDKGLLHSVHESRQQIFEKAVLLIGVWRLVERR